jgi:hypothetical protein
VDKCARKEIADITYEGALTQEPNTWFHSCDARGICPVRDNSNVVQIIPVTSQAAQKARMAKDGLSSVSEEKEWDSKQVQMLKEPGHTTLLPNQNWWIRQDLRKRPPLYSKDGESLPYYLVHDMLRGDLTLVRIVIASLVPQ